MKPFAILFLLIFAFGCSESGKTAGGPGSETTNGIYATVMAGDFLAKGASVALRKNDFVPVDSSSAILRPDFFADSLGNIDIPQQDSGTYRLTVSLDGQIYSTEIQIGTAALDLGEIRLENPGTLSGTIFADSAQKLWVGAYGLDILEPIDSNGNFLLEGLPAGNLKIFVLSAAKDFIVTDTSVSLYAAQTTAWNHGTPVDTIVPDTIPWMLYEDFEDSSSFAEKAWYFSADTLSTIYAPTGSTWNGVSEDPDRGNVFTGRYQSAEGSYVLFGKSLSTSVDMSGLDSIVFWAKGSGAIRVSLERWELDASDNLKAWTGEISLSSTWTRYSIAPGQFLSAETDSLSTGWESVRTTVSRFHFFAVNGNEISLDDIAIYGVTF